MNWLTVWFFLASGAQSNIDIPMPPNSDFWACVDRAQVAIHDLPAGARASRWECYEGEQT